MSARSVNKIADANYFDIKDACDDKSKPFGIIWKKAGKNGEQSRGTVAVIDIDYFYKLLTKK